MGYNSRKRINVRRAISALWIIFCSTKDVYVQRYIYPYPPPPQFRGEGGSSEKWIYREKFTRGLPPGVRNSTPRDGVYH